MSQPAQLPPSQLIIEHMCTNPRCRYQDVRRTDRYGMEPDGLIRVPTVYCGGCGEEPTRLSRTLS